MKIERQTRILIVENEPEIFQWLNSRLESENVDLYWKTGSSEALTFLEENPVDIIILDLLLSEGNGLEILQSARSRTPSIRIYIFSLNKAMRGICLRGGADGFYDKSEDGDVLVELVRGDL
jgi:DNA-binding response OmpR family regulator